MKGIEYFTALNSLICSGNNLAALDLSGNTALTSLDCSAQSLTASTTRTNNTYTLNLAALDSSFVPSKVTSTSSNVGHNYDSSTGSVTFNSAPSTFTYTYDTGYTGSGGQMEVTITLTNPNTTPGDSTTAISEATFPDSSLRDYISDNVDTNGDGYLSDSEIQSVTTLNLSGLGLTALTGIENFTALTELICSGNSLTGTLDLSSNTALEYLDCSSNELTALDLSSNTALIYLDCNFNQLTSLNVDGCINLQELYCYDNSLPSLDLATNSSLTDLNCGDNELTALDLSSNPALVSVICNRNALTALDLSSNSSLSALDCSLNQLTAIDVMGTSVATLTCSSQDLTFTGVNLTGRTDYPYSLKMTDLNVSLNISKVVNLDITDSEGLAVDYLRNASEETVYFSAKPQTVKYDYYTGYSDLYMDITITVELPAFSLTLTPSTQTVTAGSAITPITITAENTSGYTGSTSSLPDGLTYSGNTITGAIQTAGTYTITFYATDNSTGATVSADARIIVAVPTGITGIAVTSPANKSITLDSSGGDFSATLSASGTPYGQVTWSVNANPDISADISGTGSTATLSGTAPANSTRQDITYTLTITASDDTGRLRTDSLTVYVSKSVIPENGGNPVPPDNRGKDRLHYRDFEIPQGLRNKLAARFGGREIFQFSDSEIISESWELGNDDLQAITSNGESVVAYLPEVMPSSSGVYVLMLTLGDVSAGTPLSLYTISDSSSGEDAEVNTSALNDADYVFLDEDGNEITTVPASGNVYAALNLTAGESHRGVVTTASSLKVGTIEVVTEDNIEVSLDTLIENVAEVMNVSEDAIKFITEENISEPQEPTRTIRTTLSAKNETIIGKLNTLTVSEDGYYVFKVTLSDDLYEQIKGVSINDLRAYALYDNGEDDPESETAQVRASFIIGLLNTWELLTLSGEKLKFSAQTFLMVGILNAGTPMSVYLAKILLLLLGGCNTGAGIAGLIAVGVSAIYFIRRRKH